MGLTVVAFLATPLLVLFALSSARRGRGLDAGRVVAAVDLLLAAFCLCQGLAFSSAYLGGARSPLLIELLSGASLLAAHLALLYLSLVFPSPAPIAARAAGLAAVAAAACYGAYRIVGTADYAVALFRSLDAVARIDGTRFRLISGVQAGIGAAAAMAVAARALPAKDRITRQRAAVASAGILVGCAMIWLFSGAVPTRSGVRPSYWVMPLGALAVGAIVTYAHGLSRIFDWGAIGRHLASYALLYAAAGLPAGLAAYLLGFLRPAAPAIAAAGAAATFLAAYSGARSLSGRLLARVRGRGDYREELESALSHVDLALGRDAVLAELRSLLCGALDFSDFSILIEDDRGALKTAYSSGGSRAAVERGSALGTALESSTATVILRSEARSDPAFEGAREDILALFESLGAEALIVAREGRHAIGAFALGPRLTGAEYTAYDRETLKALYGKLFVFAYYLKNIARESLLHTVDREIALSDQVIHFALENVDGVNRPGVDAAWTMRSTRRLGGDFVDFVRISEDRWFFVLGDVSGKGLSASMNMLILKSMIRTFLRVERSFTALVARINAFIKGNLPRGTFFAGVFGYFDFAEGSFYYINCGVPAILLYSPALDTFIEIQGEGRVLGFVRDIAPYLRPRKVSIPRGTVLAAVTDGVTDSESLRGERYGKDRLKRSVRERLSRPAREIADGVVEDLLAFTDHKQEDDITLLILKI